MATFDQLRADQQAILQLVLQRGQSYDDLAGVLGVPTTRVRELAGEALAQLAPGTARRVDPEWRPQLVDYLLGQQSGPESRATRGHLKASETGRTWALSLIDALDDLYTDATRPEVPEAEAGATASAPAPPRARRERRPREPRRRRDGAEAAARPPILSPGTWRPERRRQALAGLVALLVLVAGVTTWLIAGGDEQAERASGDDQTQPAGQGGAPRILQQVDLRPPEGGGDARGQAVVAQRGNQTQLAIAAQGLEMTGRNEAYEVWLYNSQEDARSIGAQVTDREGNFQGAGPLPDDWQKYRFVDVSLEKVDRNPANSGNSVLRGRLGESGGQGDGGG